MANYKRKHPRTRIRTRGSRPNTNWLNSWPRWWDIIFHTRPRRRRERVCLIALSQGADPDAIPWPVGNHKPHNYYW